MIRSNWLLMMIYLGYCIVTSLSICQASSHETDAKGEYILVKTTGETLSQATDKARMEARRAAVEETGLYVESYSSAQGYSLTHDEVSVISGGIIRITDERVSKEVVDDSTIKIIVTVHAKIDAKDLNLAEILKNKEELHRKIQRNKELTGLYEEQKRINDEIKATYGQNKILDSQAKANLEKIRSENDKGFRYTQLTGQGFQLYDKKDYKNAVKYFQEATELGYSTKTAYLIYLGLVDCYMYTNKYKEAAADAEKVLELHPGDANINAALADFYVKYSGKMHFSGSYDEAIRLAEHALNISPGHVRGEQVLAGYYYLRAMKNFQADRYVEALRDAEKVLPLHAIDGFNWEEFYFFLAGCYVMNDDDTSAIKYFEKTLEINPNNKECRAYMDELIEMTKEKPETKK